MCIYAQFLRVRTVRWLIFQLIEQFLQFPTGNCAIACDGVKLVFELQSALLCFSDVGKQLLHDVLGILYFTSRLALKKILHIIF